jgi:hypothetical protein
MEELPCQGVDYTTKKPLRGPAGDHDMRGEEAIWRFGNERASDQGLSPVQLQILTEGQPEILTAETIAPD